MSILVDAETKVIVQGITGREGRFHTEQMLEYGVNISAGVTPGKGGQVVQGIPVYNTIKEAIERHDANTVVVFVPPRAMRKAAEESIEMGVPLVITIAEGVPVLDMFYLHHLAKQAGVRLIGPNSFGIISPGKSKVGFMSHHIFSEGRVGILSRSATNAYETVFRLTKKGVGQSTVIGVGGDMIPGSTFCDLLPLFEQDEQTDIIVLIGEIGGNEEEKAADLIKKEITKPVIVLIAGKNAPKGKSMGHAGAIVSANGEGSAENKERKLLDAGAIVAESTTHISDLVSDMLSTSRIVEKKS